MALQWQNVPTARLTVRQAGTTDTFGFEGVNSSNSAGTPQQFLDAANRLLAIAGFTAVSDGMYRSVKQSAEDGD